MEITDRKGNTVPVGKSATFSIFDEVGGDLDISAFTQEEEETDLEEGSTTVTNLDSFFAKYPSLKKVADK